MIVGAGLAGLIAAHVFPREALLDAAPGPLQQHRAVLRFRSTAVSELVGIEFRKVRVRKGIYYADKFVAPDVSLANMYSLKCTDRVNAERSIWNIEPADRYVAPESLYEQLIEAVGSRIHWGHTADYVGARGSVISTAPMPTVLDALGITTMSDFKRAPISVLRYRVPNCDVHQTVYFPTLGHNLYRASITGDLMICEFAGEPDPESEWMPDLMDAFALENLDPIDAASQSHGKISPIIEAERKMLVHYLSVQHNIYSIGRFATWRNILLDDVVHDAAVVKRLLTASGYERKLAAL
jgi:hypothetical protein